jgi:poly-D-alanine transfer protein DltD
MPSKMTKKQKVQNFITKNPEAGPAEIAKKVGCAPAYAGNIRRELAADLSLPPLKRGRKAKSESKTKTTTPKPEVRRQAKTNPQRAAWEEFEAEMLAKEATDGTTPNLFRRMLNALGLQ